MRNRGLGNLISTTPVRNINTQIFPSRVVYTILDNKDEPEIFKDYGGWNSIGGVFFSNLENPSPSENYRSLKFAKPLFPNQKTFPLKNEIIYILTLPNNQIQRDLTNITYYYIFPANIWNNPHHNAIPDPILRRKKSLPKSKGYEQSRGGVVRRVENRGKDINLGKTFKELDNVKPLQPFEGDVIYEGRWGQSLRFSSTIQNSNIPNYWSEVGNDGDPITILRNGQFQEGNESWIPQVEDVNKDISTIWLTSTQKIPIKLSSNTYKSYHTPPTQADQYSGEQIIINSRRIIFNSKEDHILFSSNKSINLNAKESVNLDAPETIIQSKKVQLGDKDATEPLIFGDKFLDDFKILLQDIQALCKSLQTPIGTPTPFVPNLAIPKPSIKLEMTATKMLSQIEEYKSKISKTK